MFLTRVTRGSDAEWREANKQADAKKEALRKEVELL